MSENVLLTGGCGFIGSALVRELEEKKYNVIVLDNFIAGKPEHLDGTNAIIIEGDINNRGLLNHILKSYNVKYCYHLAAEPYIPKGYQHPTKMFKVNTMGTLNVLLACGKAKVEKIVHYSTSEVYGTAKYLPMDERHPTLPHSMYAVAKLAGDRLCWILWKERKVPVIILRQFNCFGPREAQPYIIPEIISQFSRNDNLKLGNIYAKRDFTYVHDAAKGAIKLMETSGTEGMTINLGRGMYWSVKQIAETIAKVMNKKDFQIECEQKRMRPFDVDELLCDVSLFNSTVGKIGYVPFEEGIKLTVDWYNEHGRKWSWENEGS